jgi:hypothetical protein
LWVDQWGHVQRVGVAWELPLQEASQPLTAVVPRCQLLLLPLPTSVLTAAPRPGSMGVTPARNSGGGPPFSPWDHWPLPRFSLALMPTLLPTESRHGHRRQVDRDIAALAATESKMG